MLVEFDPKETKFEDLVRLFRCSENVLRLTFRHRRCSSFECTVRRAVGPPWHLPPARCACAHGSLADSTTANRQGNDIGTQYRSAIFTYTDEQKTKAKAVLADVAKNEKFLKAFKGGKRRTSAALCAQIASLRLAIVSDRSSTRAAAPTTTIETAGQWFDAEDYHQDYLDKNPTGYCNHRPYW